MPSEIKNPILFYDGDCGLCNRSVQWLLRRDVDEVLFYSPLQGETAKELLADKKHIIDGVDSVVLYDSGTIYIKYAAVVQSLKVLPDYQGLAKLMSYLPSAIGDFAYDLVAKYRIRIFGRIDTCFLPSPQQRKRFLG